MLVIVGSKNESKIEAVKNSFEKFFKNLEVKGFELESGIASQPVSFDITVQGAINRAKAAWKMQECDYSVGIESGIFPVKEARTGYLDVGAVAIFDGKNVFLGLTPAFEYPLVIVEKILKEQKEASDAFQEIWGEYPKDAAGIIGRLTRNHVPRRLFNEMGLMMALVQIVNEKYYRKLK